MFLEISVKVIYTKDIPDIRDPGACYRTSFIGVVSGAIAIQVDDDFPDAEKIRAAYSHLQNQQSNDVPEGSFIPVEQFDAVAEKLTKAEEQLATSQGEFIAFQNDIDAMQKRIAELESAKDNLDEQSDKSSDQTETTEKPKRATKPKPEGE